MKRGRRKAAKRQSREDGDNARYDILFEAFKSGLYEGVRKSPKGFKFLRVPTLAEIDDRIKTIRAASPRTRPDGREVP